MYTAGSGLKIAKMKKQIDMLVELAKQYREFCLSSAIAVKMNSHNTLRGLDGDFSWSEKDIKEISIYFNGQTCAVRLDKFEVAFYSGKITMPYSVDEKSLQSIYEDCLDYLFYMKSAIPKMTAKEKKAKKLVELQKAKEEVARLEKSIR